LISLCDIAAIVAHYGDRLDWSQVEARAEEWNATFYIRVTLELAARLLAVPIPASRLAALRQDDGDDSILALAKERIMEEQGAVRAAADFRVRCRRRGARGTLAAVREALSARSAAASGTASPGRGGRTPPLSRFRALARDYIPLAWSLVRHPRSVAAVTERESRKSMLDSWCSPERGETEFGYIRSDITLSADEV
jgi:hypothetical protein